MSENEQRELLQAQSTRDILVNMAVAVGKLEERTEALPELYLQVTKNQTDIVWMKRFIVGGISSVGILATGFGTFIKFFSGGQ